jgi:hypothetical protein
MEKTGSIEIKISGKKGNVPITPDNYDIKEIRTVLDEIENLIFPTEKKERPIISYQISEGSVKHIFKTSIQYIIGFNALLGQIDQSKSVDFLDYSTATAIEHFQFLAVKNDYEVLISTSLENANSVKIDKSTNLYLTQPLWLNAEFYFYGKITNMGGKDKANIHLVTDDLGTLIIQTPKEEIEKIENNPLYKTFGIRATGAQHSETGEIDKSSLKFLDLIPYQPKYDQAYLTKLRERASENWLIHIDPDKWLSDLRGGYE